MMGMGNKQPKRRSSAVALDLLTPREREVLAAVAKGLTNRQTGKLLGISHRTVEVHRARLMRKLEVQSVAQLVALYLLKGLSRAKPDSVPTR
jgi:DNA-binding CsgD family transcriptional regulator